MRSPSFVWDDVAKAGYLSLRHIGAGEIARTSEVPDDPRVLVDFDADGNEVGVEFLSDVPVSALFHWAGRFDAQSIEVRVRDS